MDPDVERKVEFLSRRGSYPGCPDAVEVVETHMSWLFLTPDYVYKMKKPVRYTFLDFSTLGLRRADCEREVRLNRRLAGEVYIGTIALTRRANGDLALDGSGAVVEWLVKMKRLPSNKMLDQVVGAGQVSDSQLESAARKLARFYRTTDSAPFEGAGDYHRRLRDDIRAHRDTLLESSWELPGDTVRRVAQRQLDCVDTLSEELARRATMTVDGHGDLRPEHICLTEPPVVIDCLEFNRALRIVDPVDDLAFLALECDRADAAGVGQRFLTVYSQETGDVFSDHLVAFYKSVRAALKAKIAVWHIADDEVRDHGAWERRAGEYLEMAEHYLTPC